MTTGIISRYYIRKNEGIETLRMSATAEIGGGASGGPLLNASGAVVGMASKTLSFLGPAHDNDHRVVQMVIKQSMGWKVLRTLSLFIEHIQIHKTDVKYCEMIA